MWDFVKRYMVHAPAKLQQEPISKSLLKIQRKQQEFFPIAHILS